MYLCLLLVHQHRAHAFVFLDPLLFSMFMHDMVEIEAPRQHPGSHICFARFCMYVYIWALSPRCHAKSPISPELDSSPVF